MKAKILSTALLITASLSSSVLFAAPQDPSKSTNVKSTLISNCKEAATTQGKLASADADKFCKCQVEAEGRVTESQKWEIISLQNQKKDPSTLAFVQQNKKTFETCLGPQLISKLQSAAQAAAQK
ncbi:hypothetical protein F4V57_00365 [Acinetobacter qingfengensis]|uniref:Uncharacterized protein n=1 Tax=Acinetobacter qingfengensis TaxID=1262585 RepID=A0A1E7RDJ2_9GAMM|nr:hypothetical protein [Acinetobacter qingfengensis]KAA8735292.1 hypothetical protein F4V57_00365 [Acinetobacter qingfengensis]OEY97411.1 hypothetical protein BJI46_09920 [Acinetobacter qingfengensis]